MSVFDASNSFALLIGIATYEKPNYESLPWVANNLKRLKSLLVDPYIFGFQVERVLDRIDLTRGEIAEELESIRNKALSLDTLLVYYCGHGVVSSGKYYITGRDAGDIPTWNLGFDEFENIFLRINAQRKILILDSCFSARAITGHLGDANSVLETNVEHLADQELKRKEALPNRIGTFVLASADRDKPSPAKDGSGDFTAFTALLVTRLSNGLPNIEAERLNLNTIADALAIEATNNELPVPVQSDKFGLGKWALSEMQRGGRIARGNPQRKRRIGGPDRETKRRADQRFRR
jgi:hypothetical protein